MLATMPKASGLRSMTGYAVIETEIGDKKFRLHLKSVNHRFFEMRWKSPRSWLGLEVSAKSLFQKILERGTVDFWVEDLSSDEAGSKDSDRSSVADFFKRLHQAVNESGPYSWTLLPPPIRALILARYPDLWLKRTERTESTLDEALVVRELEVLALALDEARRKEGQGISDTLQKVGQELRSLSQKISDLLPGVKEVWEQDFKERLERIAADFKVEGPSHDRLLQEWLIMAEKREVSEELQRIGSHLELLEDILVKSPPNSGKKLEFLAQELHREWTTLGNKLHNAELAQKIMDAKVAIEKIREQTLNIA